jgi:hypothetical protein
MWDAVISDRATSPHRATAPAAASAAAAGAAPGYSPAQGVNAAAAANANPSANANTNPNGPPHLHIVAPDEHKTGNGRGLFGNSDIGNGHGNGHSNGNRRGPVGNDTETGNSHGRGRGVSDATHYSVSPASLEREEEVAPSERSLSAVSPRGRSDYLRPWMAGTR